VELEYVGQDLASRDLGVHVGEDGGSLVDVLDGFVAGIARRDPGRQAGHVVRYRDPRAGQRRCLAMLALGEQQRELSAGLLGCPG
jgi:adenylosuccinate synthase